MTADAGRGHDKRQIKFSFYEVRSENEAESIDDVKKSYVNVKEVLLTKENVHHAYPPSEEAGEEEGTCDSQKLLSTNVNAHQPYEIAINSTAVPLKEMPADEDKPSAGEETADELKSWSFEEPGSAVVDGESVTLLTATSSSLEEPFTPPSPTSESTHKFHQPSDAPPPSAPFVGNAHDVWGRPSEQASSSSKKTAHPLSEDTSLLTSTMLVSLLAGTVRNISSASVFESAKEEEDVPQLDIDSTSSQAAEIEKICDVPSPSTQNLYQFYQPSTSSVFPHSALVDMTGTEDTAIKSESSSYKSEQQSCQTLGESEGVVLFRNVLEVKDETSEQDTKMPKEWTAKKSASSLLDRVSAEGAPEVDTNSRSVTSTSVKALISLLSDIRTHEQKLHRCLSDIRALEEDLHESSHEDEASNEEPSPNKNETPDDLDQDSSSLVRGDQVTKQESFSNKEPAELNNNMSVFDGSLIKDAQNEEGKTNVQKMASNKNKDEFSQETLSAVTRFASLGSPVEAMAAEKLNKMFHVMCSDMCRPLGAPDCSSSLDWTTSMAHTEKCSVFEPESIEIPLERHLRGYPNKQEPFLSKDFLQTHQPLEKADDKTYIAKAQAACLESFELRTADILDQPLEGETSCVSIDAACTKAHSPWAAHLKSLESKTKGNLALLQMYHKRKETEISLLEKYMLS